MLMKHIVEMLYLMRVGQIDVSSDSSWARCSCPLSPFTHKSGKDNNPSFGVRSNSSGLSTYNCFTCGSGSLLKLFHILSFNRGVSAQVRNYFFTYELWDGDTNDKTIDSIISYPDVYSDQINAPLSPIPVPSEVIEKYPLIEGSTRYEGKRCKEYLNERGIRDEIIFKYRLRYHPHMRGIVFPIYDDDGQIYKLHIRLRTNKIFFYITPEIAGMSDITQWGRKDIWYGMEFYDPKKPVIVVESETDLLRLNSLGVDNVVASCGPLNDAKIHRLGSRVVFLGFDSDEAGVKFCKKFIYVNRCSQNAQLIRLSWAVAGIKDAGDLVNRDQFDFIYDRRIYLDERGEVMPGQYQNYCDAYVT